MHASARAMILACTAAALSVALSAQQAVDLTRVPAPGKTPVLHVPSWTRTTIGNGATLEVSEKHDLPLVSFSITFLGGADQFDPPAKRGVGSLTAAMLSEGTTTRDGVALSNALQLLGTDVSVSIGGESGTMSFVSTAEKYPQTLDILADMLLHPTFPQASLERLRAQRLVALAQAKAQPASIAARVFPRVLYGPDHPYGRTVTEATTKATTRDDIVAFHREYFKPGRALITVVGDVQAGAVKATVEKALGAWAAGGEKPAFDYPPVPPAGPTTIYLVDKPGAAQSTFTLGLPGPPRSTPDYFALQVMNMILGGQFQSRLNANLREEKGYSYGVSSGFAYGKGPGPFRAGGDIVSAKSDAALIEFMKELKGITGARPVTDEELTTARDALVQRLPGMFASVTSINGAITALWYQGLPDDYYQQYASHVNVITKEDVLRVAKTYIDLDHLAIVVVGDRASIEAPLRATGVAPIVLLDDYGNRVTP
jgi:predicted Zn-dependent peptidase